MPGSLRCEQPGECFGQNFDWTGFPARLEMLCTIALCIQQQHANHLLTEERKTAKEGISNMNRTTCDYTSGGCSTYLELHVPQAFVCMAQGYDESKCLHTLNAFSCAS